MPACEVRSGASSARGLDTSAVVAAVVVLSGQLEDNDTLVVGRSLVTSHVHGVFFLFLLSSYLGKF